MSLAIEVGALAELKKHDEEGAQWLRESFANLNAILAENDLPLHVEPEELPPLDDRTIMDSFPYWCLHSVRRAYAHWKRNPESPITPFGPDEDSAEDPIVGEELGKIESHLLCHSDCEGFYLPIPFTDVLFDDTDQDRIEGGMLCSSYQLMEELRSMSPCLGVQLVDGQLPDSEVDRLRSDIDSETGLWIERGVWLTLFESARLSIRHKTAIQFN